MSEESLELVRRVYEAWNRQDLDGLRALVHDDIVFVNPTDAVEPGTREGAEAVERVARLQWDALPEPRQEIERLEAAGDRVLAVTTLSAGIPGSDARLSQRYAGLITLRDGLVSRLELYSDVEEAERLFSG